MLAKPHWPTDAFEQWWQLYRLKRDKTHAQKCFERVRKSGELLFDDLLFATKGYMAEYDRPEDPKKFRPSMKYPATWLNKGGWSEYLERVVSPDAGGKVLIKRGSPQAVAWEKHRGRSIPWGQSGVWAVDSEYPPDRRDCT